MLYRLIILNGPQNGLRWSVPDTPMTVGSAPDCGLCLTDSEVAARHAVIEWDGDFLRIRDLGTMNRLLVNQREVREARLKHGDIIELGRTRLMVEASVRAEVTSRTEGGTRGGRRRGGAIAAVLTIAASIGIWIIARPRGATSQSDMAPGSDGGQGERAVANTVSAPPPLESAPLSDDVVLVAPVKMASNSLSEEPSPPPPEKIRQEISLSSADTSVPSEPSDQLLRRRLLEEARAARVAGRLAEAELLLNGLFAIEPANREALTERAALWERRGMIKRAIEAWTQVAADADDETRAMADQERRRLEALERRMTSTPPQVRLAEVAHAKFPAEEDAEEIRVLNIRLEAETGTPFPDPDAVNVEVVFYERETETGRIRPAENANPLLLLPEEGWPEEGPLTLVATYRGKPSVIGPDGKEARVFYGYRVRLFVYGRAADEYARPRHLTFQPTASLSAPVEGRMP